jgi:predicted nucleic acid-binding Zn ribbon protein
MSQPLKTCNKCGESKPESEWYPSRWAAGNGQWCKSCYQEWHRNRYTPKAGADDSPRACAACGESYRPKQRKASIYCSRKCGERARRESGRDRETHLLRKYGVTQEWYDDTLAKQSGGCALCGNGPSERGKYRTHLHVDHDHKTGAVRGLLCDRCNLLLGQFGDDPDRLMAAAKYLLHPPTQQLG